LSDGPEETVEIWDQDKMKRAVVNVSKKQTELKKVQKMYTLSKISLRRYVNIKDKTPAEAAPNKIRKGGCFLQRYGKGFNRITTYDGTVRFLLQKAKCHNGDLKLAENNNLKKVFFLTKRMCWEGLAEPLSELP
jgi:hypothetical protein